MREIGKVWEGGWKLSTNERSGLKAVCALALNVFRGKHFTLCISRKTRQRIFFFGKDFLFLWWEPIHFSIGFGFTLLRGYVLLLHELDARNGDSRCLLIGFPQTNGEKKKINPKGVCILLFPKIILFGRNFSSFRKGKFWGSRYLRFYKLVIR